MTRRLLAAACLVAGVTALSGTPASAAGICDTPRELSFGSGGSGTRIDEGGDVWVAGVLVYDCPPAGS